MKQLTLQEKFEDILLEYDSEEITNKTAVGHLQKVTLDFAKGFGEWIRDNAQLILMNNFMHGFYYKGQVTKIDELITLYQKHLKNQIHENTLR